MSVIAAAVFRLFQNTEDLTTCILAVEILTKLLTKASDAEREKAVKLLTVPCNYSKVFETLQLVHLKHFKNRQDAAFLKELHLKLLRLLECLYTKRRKSVFIKRKIVVYPNFCSTFPVFLRFEGDGQILRMLNGCLQGKQRTL